MEVRVEVEIPSQIDVEGVTREDSKEIEQSLESTIKEVSESTGSIVVTVSAMTLINATSRRVLAGADARLVGAFRVDYVVLYSEKSQNIVALETFQSDSFALMFSSTQSSIDSGKLGQNLARNLNITSTTITRYTSSEQDSRLKVGTRAPSSLPTTMPSTEAIGRKSKDGNNNPQLFSELFVIIPLVAIGVCILAGLGLFCKTQFLTIRRGADWNSTTFKREGTEEALEAGTLPQKRIGGTSSVVSNAEMVIGPSPSHLGETALLGAPADVEDVMLNIVSSRREKMEGNSASAVCL